MLRVAEHGNGWGVPVGACELRDDGATNTRCSSRLDECLVTNVVRRSPGVAGEDGEVWQFQELAVSALARGESANRGSGGWSDDYGQK